MLNFEKKHTILCLNSMAVNNNIFLFECRFKNVIFYHNFHFPSVKNIYAYKNLPEAEKEKIRGILFIMDKFSIS